MVGMSSNRWIECGYDIGSRLGSWNENGIRGEGGRFRPYLKADGRGALITLGKHNPSNTSPGEETTDSCVE